jgi:hypothetical protein
MLVHDDNVAIYDRNFQRLTVIARSKSDETSRFKVQLPAD